MRKHKSSATPERLAELKKLIHSKEYMASAIDSIALNMAKQQPDIDDRTCVGVECILCCDRAECAKQSCNHQVVRIASSDKKVHIKPGPDYC